MLGPNSNRSTDLPFIDLQRSTQDLDVVDEHAAATNRMHTGRPTSGTVTYPSLGSIVAHKRGAADEGVPAYMVLGYPNIVRGPGFLGPQAGFVYTTDLKSGPAGLARPTWLETSRIYRREFLGEFVKLDQTPAEQAEGLEQLRALENGRRIRCAVIEGWESTPVDVPADIFAVEAARAAKRS